MEDNPQSASRRRFFLLSVLGGIGAALSVAIGWPVWRFLAPRAGAEVTEKTVIPRREVPVGGARYFNFRGRSAVLLQNSPGEFIALSAVCTHLGCIVQWQPGKDQFLCPCHGGLYSADGRVLAGPPPRPLEQLAVTVQDDQVLIGREVPHGHTQAYC